MDGYPATVGRYRIEGLLGQGGMGLVLLGVDPQLGREVAIKLLGVRQVGSAEATTRFEREAKVLARLNDPHIVHLHDFLTTPTLALVMERLRGRTLREILNQEGPQPLPRVLDCAWQVLRGLAAAHVAGVVHRDLKPSNLMLVEGGLYKILDFGLADIADGHDLTATGDVMGTLRYLAPERRRGQEAGPPGDLWALGATLAEFATGCRPSNDGTEVPRLPGASPALDAWHARLTDPDPHQRFPSASQALQALADVQAVPFVPGASAPSLPARTDDPTALQHLSNSSRITGTIRPLVPTAPSKPARRIWHIPFVLKLITAIWIISSAATILAGWAISRHAVATQEARLHEDLAAIAASAALLIDQDLHRRQMVSPDPMDPGLTAQRNLLQRFRGAHREIRYVYTLAPLPETASTGVVQFIVDASEEQDANHNGVIDPDEERAPPGRRYPARDLPDLLQGFERPTTDANPQEDQWGLWLSGYAPIIAPDGTPLGLVGVDVPAGHIEDLRTSFLAHSLILLLSTLVAFLAAGTLVAFRLRRPVAELQRGMEAVARGDLEVPIRVTSRDEFQVLADSFEAMRQELRRAATIRQAFESFVTRALDHRSSAVHDLGGAHLYVHLLPGDGYAEGLPDRVAAAMPKIFHHAQAHGGVPERVIGGGVSIAFGAKDAVDLAQERAVRAALGMLADLEHGSGGLDLAVGIAIGADAGLRAQALGRAGAGAGLDLVLDAEDFAPLRPGFYADRVRLPDVGDVVAIKGAVSG